MPMEIVTQRESCIKQVVTRWYNAYVAHLAPGSETHPHAITYRKLQALDLETCTAKEIDDIIGNPTWTDLKCDECQQFVEFVLQLTNGAESHYMDCYSICAACFHKAMMLMETKSP